MFANKKKILNTVHGSQQGPLLPSKGSVRTIYVNLRIFSVLLHLHFQMRPHLCSCISSFPVLSLFLYFLSHYSPPMTHFLFFFLQILALSKVPNASQFWKWRYFSIITIPLNEVCSFVSFENEVGFVFLSLPLTFC